jgi:hypothetical protein
VRLAPGARVMPEGIPEGWRIVPTEKGGGAWFHDAQNTASRPQVHSGDILMGWLGKDIILDSLKELASREQQLRLWLSDGEGGEVSSFIEAYESLFTDSGLGSALKKGDVVYSENIDSRFRELREILASVDENIALREMINDQKMGLVREKAQALLDFFDHW